MSVFGRGSGWRRRNGRQHIVSGSGLRENGDRPLSSPCRGRNFDRRFVAED